MTLNMTLRKPCEGGYKHPKTALPKFQLLYFYYLQIIRGLKIQHRKPKCKNLMMMGATVVAFFLVVAACNHSSNSASRTSSTNCPDKIVIQTDWFPEPEHAYLYQLIGTEGIVDSEAGTYSGPIKGTDLSLEIRAGGPFIDFQSPSEQFYSDTDIYMAYVDTSTAIESHKATPTVAVFANFEVGPQILMWDPDVYDFESFKDIGDSGATILYFGGANYIKYLLSKGLINEGSTDGSYDGGPSRFIAEGDIVQQGFATNEPYRYQNEFENWKKPVDFLLIHDSGHQIYQSAVAVRPETIENDAACLEHIVPILQQGLVDYMNDPEPINIRLNEMVKELDSFWTSSIAGHNWSAAQMKELGLVTDGNNGYVGDMDEARIQRLIDELSPIFAAEGTDGFGSNDEALEPSAIYTNQFLDTSIDLGY